MKKICFYFSVFSLLLTSACTQQVDKADLLKEKDAIKLVLEKYVIANESQDISKIEEIWYPSEEIVSFGTEKDEKLVGISKIKEAVQSQFTRFKNTYISVHDQTIDVSEDGNTAWFAEIINYNFILNDSAHVYEGLCYTGVMNKKDGKWKLVMTHMSVPIKPLNQ
jgi:ketosteroid isomerase-like protein